MLSAFTWYVNYNFTVNNKNGVYKNATFQKFCLNFIIFFSQEYNFIFL